MANLDKDDCRDAILQHVNENCCFGKKPAEEMDITKIEGITALHVSTIYTFFIFWAWTRENLSSVFLTK